MFNLKTVVFPQSAVQITPHMSQLTRNANVDIYRNSPDNSVWQNDFLQKGEVSQEMPICTQVKSILLGTRNVFKKKTSRRIIDGEFYYRLIEISYNTERPNNNSSKQSR